jgi:hypothetical protein
MARRGSALGYTLARSLATPSPLLSSPLRKSKCEAIPIGKNARNSYQTAVARLINCWQSAELLYQLIVDLDTEVVTYPFEASKFLPIAHGLAQLKRR